MFHVKHSGEYEIKGLSETMENGIIVSHETF
jgi:hypothetical protein